MSPEILAIFIPIIFLVGLFTAISLHIYYKYKARVTVAEHARGESMDAWCRAEAMARASVSRSASLRVGGFLIGAGIGMAAGMMIGASEAVCSRFSHIFLDDHGAQLALCIHIAIAFSVLVGGVGMVCAWAVDRAVKDRVIESEQ